VGDYVKAFIVGVAAVNAMAAFEFFQSDATFLGAVGLDPLQLTPSVQWLCLSLASMHATLALLLIGAALLLDSSSRRTVAWAVGGAHLLLSENMLRLRELLHVDSSSVADKQLLRCGTAAVIHVVCAMALVACAVMDMARDPNLSRAPASDDEDPPKIPMVPFPGDKKDDAGAAASSAASPSSGQTPQVDWRTFKATTSSSSSPSPGASPKQQAGAKKKN
jgi:hypothetical protein